MNPKIKSLLRTVVTAVLGLGILIAVLGLFIRQPSFRTVGYSISERSDQSRLEAHVRFLSDTVLPRNTRNLDNLNRAADYIAEALAGSGGRVEEQPYHAGGVLCRNIRARFGPDSGALLIVGAHYDVCGDLPGADDNGSGVAGLLEIGRLLGTNPPPVPVELVAFSTEETPFFGGPEMGSAIHANALRDDKVAVAGMICLEMIGYFTERQPSPHWIIGLLYPRKGDFITVVGRWHDRGLVGHVKAAIKGAGGVRACSFTGPPILGADLSDHRNYWFAGYPAVMITDTAYIRNPNYHTALDLPETLDYRRMAAVTDGVLNAVISYQPAGDR
jgi:hypothetical protein